MSENGTDEKEYPDTDFEIPEVPEPRVMEEEPEEKKEEREPEEEKKIKPIYLNILSLFWGALLNLFLCLIIWRLWPNSWGIAGGVASLIYFGFYGIHKTEIGWKAVPFVLGGRLPELMKDFLFKEGYCWTFPKPFMGIGKRDCREKATNFPVIKEPSKDDVVMQIEVSARTKIVDVYQSFGVEDPIKSLTELVERICRWATREKTSDELPDEKKELSKRIAQETNEIAIPDWGLDTMEIWVKSVRRPAELEADLLKQKLEKIQKKSQKTEAENLRDLMEIVGQNRKELSDEQLLNAAMGITGKIKLVNVGGNADGFTKGAALNQGQKGSDK